MNKSVSGFLSVALFTCMVGTGHSFGKIQVFHLPPSGKLSLVMPASAPSEIEFRNIRLKV
jgi:hypothetical protein